MVDGSRGAGEGKDGDKIVDGLVTVDISRSVGNVKAGDEKFGSIIKVDDSDALGDVEVEGERFVRRRLIKGVVRKNVKLEPRA